MVASISALASNSARASLWCGSLRGRLIRPPEAPTYVYPAPSRESGPKSAIIGELAPLLSVLGTRSINATKKRVRPIWMCVPIWMRAAALSVRRPIS